MILWSFPVIVLTCHVTCRSSTRRFKQARALSGFLKVLQYSQRWTMIIATVVKFTGSLLGCFANKKEMFILISHLQLHLPHKYCLLLLRNVRLGAGANSVQFIRRFYSYIESELVGLETEILFSKVEFLFYFIIKYQPASIFLSGHKWTILWLCRQAFRFTCCHK